MPEGIEIRNRIKQLDEGGMRSVAEKLARNEEVAPEELAEYKQRYEKLLSEPVLKSTPENKIEVDFSPQNLADAKEVLRGGKGMVLPEEKNGVKEEKENKTRFNFEKEMEVNDTVPEARDRFDAYKITRQRLMKEKPEGWVDKLTLLRVKMDEVEATAKTGKVDIEEAGRRYENLFNPLTAGNIKQQKDAARRWIDSYKGKIGVNDEQVRTVEAIFSKEFKLSEDEENTIRQYCLDSVFDRNANNAMSVYSSFFGPQGYLHTDMGKTIEEVDLFRERIKEISDELGLDNWISVRNVVGEWSVLKKVEEITAGTLKEGLFVPEYTERFFAGIVDPLTNKVVEERMITLPDGREVDIQAEVSGAMKKLREFFETTDYYAYVGSGMDIKSKLYKELGINKYVGEVGFSLLLSHLMLTDCKKTSTDPFMSMVVGGEKRIYNYSAIEEDKDTFIRMGVQSLKARGVAIIDSSNKLIPGVKDSLNKWISKSLPSKLIPTGLSGDGRENLNDGNWLKWRVDNTFTKAERATTLSRVSENTPVEIANDTETRLVEMQSALKILDALKEVVKPESDISSLGKLKGTLLAHVKGTLKGAGWTNGDNINLEFDYVSNGSRPVSLDEWATCAMLTACKAFLYTHSVADHLNRKPWTKFVLAENARIILSQKVQSEKDAYLGFDPAVRQSYRKSFVGYVDTLWSQVHQIFEITQNRNKLSKLPKWYKSGAGISDEIIKAAIDSQDSKQYDAWRKVKEDLRL